MHVSTALSLPRLLQLEEETIDYPSWALFIGAVIVLSSQLVIPVVLIGRLILFEEARQQARDFLQVQVEEGVSHCDPIHLS